MAARKQAQAVVVAEPEALQQARTSLVNIPIGNRVYQAKRDPTCSICTHPGRVKIEERILYNEGYKDIAAWASDHEAERYDGVLVPWPTVDAKHIARHFRAGHCPVDAKVLHELQEQRSGHLDYTELTGRVVDHVVFSQQTVARTQERAVRGEIEPTYKEGLAAAKLLADVERSNREVEQQDTTWAMEEAFAIYFEEAKAVMSKEQWDTYSVRLTQNPKLRELIERVQNPDGVIDAEVVEENPS